MANVNIAPTINHGEQDINKMVKQLLNAYIVLTEELTHILNHLDTRNMTEIDGDILVSGTVTAGKIQVDKLSAISANIGKVTAGEIYGNYIATQENMYPRAEMSNTNNLFSALSAADSHLSIYSSGQNNSPQMTLKGPSMNISLLILGLVAQLTATGGDLLLGGKNVQLSPSTSGRIEVPYWNQLYSVGDNRSLKSELIGKAQSGVSTSLSGGHNHGIPAGTQFKDVNGVTWTWSPTSDHSHAQN